MRISRLKAEIQAARTLGMVENIPLNLVMADKDLRITYLNPAAKKTLESLSAYLPVKVDQIVGSSIDIFHQDKERPRRIVLIPRTCPMTPGRARSRNDRTADLRGLRP